MPITVKCSRCGHVLVDKIYSIVRDFGVTSKMFIDQVILENNGKCPKCNHKLVKPANRAKPSDYIEISAYMKTTNDVFDRRLKHPNRHKARRKPKIQNLTVRMCSECKTARISKGNKSGLCRSCVQKKYFVSLKQHQKEKLVSKC